MYDAIKLGGRVVDLLERGVVALEKLAGVEKTPDRDLRDTPCYGCSRTIDDHPNDSGCEFFHEGR